MRPKVRRAVAHQPFDIAVLLLKVLGAKEHALRPDDLAVPRHSFSPLASVRLPRPDPAATPPTCSGKPSRPRDRPAERKARERLPSVAVPGPYRVYPKASSPARNRLLQTI